MTDPTNRPEGWDRLGAEWRAPGAAEPASVFAGFDPQEVRARAAAFARRIRHRNVREIVAGAVVVLAGVRIAYRAHTLLVTLGGASMAIGAAFVTASILLRARNLASPPSDAPTRDVLAYERAQLERQARLLERVWVWYLAPLVPSVVLIYADVLSRALAEGRPLALPLGRALATLLVFVLIGWMNGRAARALRARMPALGSVDEAER